MSRNPLRERSNRMVTIVNRNACVRPARHGNAYASPATILVAIAWLLSGLLPASASAEVLRWKFKAGEVMHYSIEMKTQMNVKLADRQDKSSQSQVIDMSWTVLSVAPGGEAEITQRIDRIRMKVERPPYMPFDFDSSSSKGVAAGFEEGAKHLKSMVGLEFSFSDASPPERSETSSSRSKLSRQFARRHRAKDRRRRLPRKHSRRSSSRPVRRRSPKASSTPGKTWKGKPGAHPDGNCDPGDGKDIHVPGP